MMICKGADIEMRKIEEEIKSERDIVLIPMEVFGCLSCGERCYERNAMRKSEEIRLKLNHNVLEVEEVGKVLKAHSA
jgi:hypothetical protein